MSTNNNELKLDIYSKRLQIAQRSIKLSRLKTSDETYIKALICDLNELKELIKQFDEQSS